MKIQLLPSTFDGAGCATPEQRLTCFLIDDRVTVDAGSIALALTDEQRESVRDVIVTHPHMDHIASLPIFIDDLFGSLTEPVRVHATEEVIALLERDVFNWTVYPRFSELKNQHGPVMQYMPFRTGEEFQVAHLKVTAVPVNHIVPTVGMVVSDGKVTVAFSSDTYHTEEFWELVNSAPHLDALLIEASFPNSMAQLAEVSRHFTPAMLKQELQKLNHNGLDILTVHLKPAYRETLVEEINGLGIPRLGIMEPGRTYEW
ncbi:MAG: 3',5'-cyclic-nucleotide phosphodiesterase [Pyrinomonadaceae bacterium]|nr:3',5'-cyclic-nucleotide phosphodiesterase [Pyrinomonadaceae bacterium]